MASRIFVHDLLVPKGTAKTSPTTFSTTFAVGLLDQLELVFPTGCNGLVGFRLRAAGQAVVPINRDAFVIANGEVIRWDLEGHIQSGSWSAQAFNTDVFDHTLQLRLLVSEVPTPAAAVGAVIPVGPGVTTGPVLEGIAPFAPPIGELPEAIAPEEALPQDVIDQLNEQGVDVSVAMTVLDDLVGAVNGLVEQQAFEAELLSQIAAQLGTVSDTLIEHAGPPAETVPPARRVEVPNVVGRKAEVAVDMIERVNLRPIKDREYSDEKEGRVFRQRPKAGVSLPRGSTVLITISRGKKPARDVEEDEDKRERRREREPVEPDPEEKRRPKWVWPVDGRITGRFCDPRPTHHHEGLDIANNTGTPIKASRMGRVSFAGNARGYGLVVYIEHQGDWQTRYAHLSSIGTRVGEKVKAGEQVGRMGMTGTATGPHLHFETRLKGEAVDPLGPLPKKK